MGTVQSLRGLSAARSPKRVFDLLEIRVDLLRNRDTARKRVAALRKRGLPVLVTIRSAAEGGAWRNSEANRLEEYERWLEVADAVDAEIQSALLKPLASLAHEKRRLVIGSFHDFDQTPPLSALRAIVRRGYNAGADVVKIATRARNAADLDRLARLLRGCRRPLCVLPLGSRNLRERVRMVEAGSCWTYGYVDRPAAPGQPSARALKNELRRKRLWPPSRQSE